MTALTTCNACDTNPMAPGQDVPGEPGYCLECIEDVILGQLRPTCLDCRTPLTYPGRGRPPARCQPCRQTHRRAQLRAAQQRHRT